MDKVERRAYDRHIDNIMVQNDVLDTAKMEGRAEGREEGRAEGRAEGREEGRAEGRADEKKESARKMKAKGLDSALISEITGLEEAEIEKL